MKEAASPRIFRILLQARDLDRSRRFYESLLSTKGRKVGGGRVYFDSGTIILALVDATAEGEAPVACLPEPLYFATEDLEDVYRRASRLGCLSAGLIHNDPANPAGRIVTRPWGERSFYAADPSGNPLCFVDSSTLFTGTGRPGARTRSDRRERHRSSATRQSHSPGRAPRRPRRLTRSAA